MNTSVPNALGPDEAIFKFADMQRRCVSATKETARSIQPGMSELDIANQYQQRLSALGLVNHWYPLLVYAGASTALPISRRFHLPSDDVVVRKDDIVMLDCTPQDGTVWANWAETFQIGNGAFIRDLIHDADQVADAVYHAAVSGASKVGELFDLAAALIAEKGLTSLDPRDDIGHDIFQVPAGQTVDATPDNDRLFLSNDHRDRTLEGVISVEPQLGRINQSGQMLSVKTQRVFAPGYSLNSDGTMINPLSRPDFAMER
jgi:Xaa-Pro aminopeptidase